MILRNRDQERRDLVSWVQQESSKSWTRHFAWSPIYVYNEKNDHMEIWLQYYWRNMVIYDNKNLKEQGKGWYYQYKSYNPNELPKMKWIET